MAPRMISAVIGSSPRRRRPARGGAVTRAAGRLAIGVPIARAAVVCASRAGPAVDRRCVGEPSPPGRGEEGASIFGRYGQLPALREGTKPEDLVAEMDAAGVALAGLCGTDAAWVAETCARWPGRFFGMVSPDPRDIMACLRTIETCVREHGFKAVKLEPFVW